MTLHELKIKHVIMKITDKCDNPVNYICGGSIKVINFTQFTELHPTIKNYILIIKKGMEEFNLVGLRAKGNYHNYYFEFNNGMVFQFTQRGWASIQGAIKGKLYLDFI